MPKYLVMATYVGEGVEGLMEEGGSARREAVVKLLDSVGGKLESIYYAFGDIDVYAVVELPDNVTAAAVALTINASGEVSVTTTPLLTPEEIDQAVKKSPDYRAPGD
ncbi:MAG TPA: GYD domain-containing protein [Dehalococcoidia bacterium]|nr:GYD domain-containing protein [Dehalococcoidia bacterium]